MMSSRRREVLEAEDFQPRLPDEMMYLIMGKLLVFPMCLARFSAVCKRWHRLVCDAWPKLIQDHQIAPLVLVPAVDQKEEGVVKHVSCRIYNLMGESAPAPVNSLPYPYGFTRIIGSSFGWLIVDNMNESVLLFNPLSKSHIRLPPLHLYGARMVKGVLSKPPRPEEEEDEHFDIAITISHRINSPAIVVLHVEKMGELESLQWLYYVRTGGRIMDVNSIGGRICALYSNGAISCLTDRSMKYYDVMGWPLSGNLTSGYLLESSSSEPLVVLRYELQQHSSPTVGFKVLTLTNNDELNKTWNWTDLQCSVLNWTETETLGNDVVFLGDTASICVQAGSELLQTADSIYFADQECYHPDYPPEFGVFNVNKKCHTHCSHRPPDDDGILGTKILQSQQLFWLLPTYDEILKFSSID